VNYVVFITNFAAIFCRCKMHLYRYVAEYLVDRTLSGYDFAHRSPPSNPDMYPVNTHQRRDR